MRKTKVINVSDELIQKKAQQNEKIYLSDIPEFKNNNINILKNTVFNKSVTGIGGTTLALKSNENIIILMPFVEVVENKENTVSDSFTVKGGVTIPSITKYLKTTKKRKIVSTYDGLYKIVEAYKKAKLNVYDDFLLIDEWQILFQHYGLRSDVIRYLLDESLNFKNKCFMTATPIKKEYWFNELKNLDELILNYDLEPVILKHYVCKNIVDEAIAIIRDQSNDYNLHFFINSVDTIKTITKTLDLNKEDVRVICSKKEKNESKLSGYKIESTKDPVKKINFYTSTCYEGCDIFDKKGKIIVLCDGLKAHTLVDISTTLPQIAGRIRDIEDDSVNLIYSSTRYINVSEDEFNEAINKNIQTGYNIIKGVTNEDAINALDTDKINSYYLMVKDGKLHFEVVLFNVDKANFEMAKTYHYKANKIATTKMKKFRPVKVEKPWANEIEKMKAEKIEKMSFKDQCIKYDKIKNLEFHLLPHFDPDVIKAVDKLGIDRIENLNYHKGNVMNALLKESDISQSVKVFRNLKLQIGEYYTSKQLKEMFTTIYKNLGIKATPKGTDVLHYYHTKVVVIRENGKSTKAHRIIAPKLVV